MQCARLKTKETRVERYIGNMLRGPDFILRASGFRTILTVPPSNKCLCMRLPPIHTFMYKLNYAKSYYYNVTFLKDQT